MDSATALYWNEATVSPQGELQYATLYGIEYLNVHWRRASIGALRKLGEWSTAKNQLAALHRLRLCIEYSFGKSK